MQDEANCSLSDILAKCGVIVRDKFAFFCPKNVKKTYHYLFGPKYLNIPTSLFISSGE